MKKLIKLSVPRASKLKKFCLKSIEPKFTVFINFKAVLFSVELLEKPFKRRTASSLLAFDLSRMFSHLEYAS